MENLKQKVDAIVKFVDKIYSPKKIQLEQYVHPDRYLIIFYFDEIDDMYIRNPQARDITEHKESMLNRKIRTNILKYLSIKTTGLQPPDFYSPSEYYPITTVVKTIK